MTLFKIQKRTYLFTEGRATFLCCWVTTKRRFLPSTRKRYYLVAEQWFYKKGRRGRKAPSDIQAYQNFEYTMYKFERRS